MIGTRTRAPVSSTSVAGRARATQLAPTDSQGAFEAASGIEDSWYAAQAFATVARYAHGAMQERAFRAARAAARNGKDAYQRSAVLAWPLRAAIETGRQELAYEILTDAIGDLRAIDYFSSRAQAFDLLFQAAFPGGTRLWQRLLDELALVPPESHWRAARLRRLVACILAVDHPRFAQQLIEGLPAGRLRRTCERDLREGIKGPPRGFF